MSTTLQIAVKQVDEAFRRFVSNKRDIKTGPRGQTIGCEAFRLEFTGFQEAEVNDAILSLHQIANPTPSTEDLEECLAGFMITSAINGAYLGDDMKEWARKKLEGKQRTPVEVWMEIAKSQTTNQKSQ